jgi:AraC family transcriptional regulator of adaptative response/methylated-DNA-[protein]-cysteine methyltransferase
MTFVEYARARRLGEAFKSIRSGERVIGAQIDAGYESGSGFRDAFAKIMGVPPASEKAPCSVRRLVRHPARSNDSDRR